MARERTAPLDKNVAELGWGKQLPDQYGLLLLKIFRERTDAVVPKIGPQTINGNAAVLFP